MTDPIIRRTVLAILATILLTFTGCGRPGRFNDRMDQAEHLMESRPDSALSILSTIDKSRLAGDETKARYALLMSMAIDKNYIDTTNFDILQPAIDYYLKKGTPDEKLRTCYYQGRIYQNKGDIDSALRSYNICMDISPNCTDSLCIARTLVAQGKQFFELYDYESYAGCLLRAAEIYKNKSYKWHEFDCLINALNGYASLKNKAKADSILSICEGFDNLENDQKLNLISYQLSYANIFNDTTKLKHLVEILGDNPDFDSNSIIDLASAYDHLGNHAKAKHLLDSIHKATDYDPLKYLAISVSVYKNIGDYKKAFADYNEFSRKWNSIYYVRFEQKLKSLEEKHQLEFKAEQEARRHSQIIWGCIGGIIFLLMVVIILALLFRRNKNQKDLAIEKAKSSELERKKLKSESDILTLENKNLQLERDKQALEAENLSHRVELLESECSNLKELIESQEELPAEVQQAIKVRIELLNELMSRSITGNAGNEQSSATLIKELTDNTMDFMNSNRLAFQVSHPRFIQYFEERGLTVGEINYVCLYAIGLKGKDVGKYLKMRSHVNISSGIRKKLGIDKHETNIGIYVRKLLKDL